jgi:2-C-methyl-D-erythritol 4-phosphate cytidylyltransferase
LRHALTPQCFRYELLRRAYEQANDLGADVTDDSALVERLGEKVAIVQGHPRNIKITRPEDLAIAELILKSGVWSLES